jgi:hypothetical protein
LSVPKEPPCATSARGQRDAFCLGARAQDGLPMGSVQQRCIWSAVREKSASREARRPGPPKAGGAERLRGKTTATNAISDASLKRVMCSASLFSGSVAAGDLETTAAMTETNRICSALFGMQRRPLGPYLTAMHSHPRFSDEATRNRSREDMQTRGARAASTCYGAQRAQRPCDARCSGDAGRARQSNGARVERGSNEARVDRGMRIRLPRGQGHQGRVVPCILSKKTFS